MLDTSNPGFFSRSIALILPAAMLGAALAVLGTGASGTAAANGPVASQGGSSMIEERDWYAPEGCTRPGFDTWVLGRRREPAWDSTAGRAAGRT